MVGCHCNQKDKGKALKREVWEHQDHSQTLQNEGWQGGQGWADHDPK